MAKKKKSQKVAASRDIDLLQQQIGYKFKNVQLLERALRHKTAGQDHNERLEFLGDSLLNNTITRKLYELYGEREGDLTERRSKIVCNKNLVDIAICKLKLHSFIEIGTGVNPFEGHRMADFFEALVGAIYADSDETAAEQFVMKFCWEPATMDIPKKQVYNNLQAINQIQPVNVALIGTRHILSRLGGDLTVRRVVYDSMDTLSSNGATASERNGPGHPWDATRATAKRKWQPVEIRYAACDLRSKIRRI